MKPSLLTFASGALLASSALAQGLTNSSLTTYVDTLTLPTTFNPIKAAYWTGLPHHRRTPFALSPDGTTAYLAYLDASLTDVHVQPLDPSTFTATGTPVTMSGAKEAGGLVAHDDGFALLTNEALPSGTADAPGDSTPVPVVYRFDSSGTQTWKTFLGGPSVSSTMGLMASPDINGDLVFSETAGYYAAYIVVTAYSGDAEGHYGDAIRYLSNDGTLTSINGASSDWGCSHNTGIALEAADAAPFASICAEDQGAIWLNTVGQGMTTSGSKISSENTTNGAGGESLGGMSGSYSNLARFGGNSSEYLFAWVSRGATTLSENTWMGDGYTTAVNRTNGRNVAVAILSDKSTLVGGQASSTVGDTDGDSQVNFLTSGTADCSNAHAATFNSTHGLVTWEQIDAPQCNFVAMGCQGAFSGSYFQLISNDGNGAAVGAPLVRDDVYVAGDMVTMADGRVCWPYVSGTWDLDTTVGDGASGTTTGTVSFACVSLDGATSSDTANAVSVASSSSAVYSADITSTLSTPASTSLSAAFTADITSTLSASSQAAVAAVTSKSIRPYETIGSAAMPSSSASASSSVSFHSISLTSSLPGSRGDPTSSVAAGNATMTGTGSGSKTSCPPKRTMTVYA